MSETNTLNTSQPVMATLGVGRIVINDYVIQITDITGGHRLTVTRGSEVQTMDVMNGVNGQNGAKGDKGDTGSTGPAGAKGDKGDTGATGPAGAKGDKGDTGATGPAGAKGDTGATGPAGAKGDKGDTGATGPAGAKGDKGDTGATGPAGAKGDKGDTGETGPAGAKGDKGDTGATGPAGAKGDKGDTGSTGPAGAKGDKGDTGETGPAGAKGDKGDTGNTGPAGAKGDKGDTGDNGIGVPIGGTAGQMLCKNTNTDYDCIWKDSGQYFICSTETPFADAKAAYEAGKQLIGTLSETVFSEIYTGYLDMKLAVTDANNVLLGFLFCGTFDFGDGPYFVTGTLSSQGYSIGNFTSLASKSALNDKVSKVNGKELSTVRDITVSNGNLYVQKTDNTTIQYNAGSGMFFDAVYNVTEWLDINNAIAANKIIRLQLEDGNNYVLLSNYTEAGDTISKVEFTRITEEEGYLYCHLYMFTRGTGWEHRGTRLHN